MAVLCVPLLALALVCGAGLFPARAHAWYNEASTSYPASQDLGVYTAPIYGSDLPDGTYQVTARTSSRMCIMYTDPANAEARDSKEQAIISVSGGNITALFYISKAYTHLYWGTAEDAAAATNADGTDASAYIPGDPDEGYVPHLFALPISALNEPFIFSAYSGGDKGVKGGKWYTREAVFIMTEAEYQAIIAGVQGEDPGAQGDPGTQVDPGTDPGYVPEEPLAPEQPDLDPDPEPEQPEEETSQPELRDDNVVPSGEGGNAAGSNEDGTGVGDEGDGSAEEGEGEGASNADGSGTTTTKRGVRMSGVASDTLIEVDEAKIPPPVETEKPLLTPQQIVGLVVLGLLVLGLAARVALFARDYERGCD